MIQYSVLVCLILKFRRMKLKHEVIQLYVKIGWSGASSKKAGGEASTSLNSC